MVGPRFSVNALSETKFIFLSGSMVRGGWTLAFVKHSDRYAADEAEAQRTKVGIWAGSFIKPWDWRLGEAEAAQKTRTCVIKGNINENGQRIYHLPFQHFYRRVKIDETRGERWFCTEQDAREAGWLSWLAACFTVAR